MQKSPGPSCFSHAFLDSANLDFYLTEELRNVVDTTVAVCSAVVWGRLFAPVVFALVA